MVTTTATKQVRYSETRDIIYDYLCRTKAHPSAEMIYNDLKPTLPKLSLKTVYTNLRFFEEHGKVVRAANVSGSDRYDAICEEHVHLVCDECGAVIDIMDADIRKAKKACQAQKVKIKRIQIVLHGTCENCSVNLKGDS